MKHPLAEKLPLVSTAPGVYLMKNEAGQVIYVGKALNLKKRLTSYFSNSTRKDIKTGVLVHHITSFETIITGTEKEALILESNLIKRYRPRYNVILKDDKRYPSLYIDINSDFPNISVVRKIKKNNGLYFGPFSSSLAVKETLKAINKVFKIRKCKSRQLGKRERPCLNFQMGACHAPCCGYISRDAYREIINEVVLFLKGKTPQLIQKVRFEMKAAADERDYEKAAELRDRIFALEKTLEKQIVVTSDFMDRDVLAVASDAHSVITMLTVRNGFLRGTRTFHISETMASDPELLESFIRQYYERLHFIPGEILVSVPLESAGLLEDFLKGIKGKKVTLRFPQRGEKKKLVEMAVKNANTSLAEQMAADSTLSRLLERLQKRLNLSGFPQRIECFDISNTAGTVPVAGIVVFTNGKPEKSLYRSYAVKSVSGPDDYAAMSEVLYRRFRKKDTPESYPDLLMVDGGKGQLNIAVDVLKQLNIFEKFNTIAIAKKDEERGDVSDKIFLPHRSNPIHFGKEQDLLLFLQKIRDESHRYSVSFHRRKRNRLFISSVLDDIPGIGKKRKEMLLRHFGSIKKIRAASPEEISELPGMNLKTAELILNKLGSAED